MLASGFQPNETEERERAAKGERQSGKGRERETEQNSTRKLYWGKT